MEKVQQAERDKLKEQRDELLAALKYARKYGLNQAQADAAIAKAEGV